jgi:predicted DNA-binding transcriptional regulator YafY
MNRVERLTGTLLLLQSRRRRHTAAEIAGHFGVSRRTILRDVEALTALGVPVLSSDGVGGGYELPPDYALTPLPLTTSEALLLLLALDGMAKLTDTPFGGARESLIAKLRGMLAPGQVRAADSLLTKVSLEVPEREGHRAVFLDELLAALRREGWIAATYDGRDGHTPHTLLPRRVYSHGGFWYCDAYSHERGAERKFRVDRFTSVATAETPPNADPTAPLPYDHPSHPEIVAELTARGVRIAEAEPHLGQSVERREDGAARMAFRCPPGELDWFASYFLRLGDDAELLSPGSLRQEIANRAEKLVARYGKR